MSNSLQVNDSSTTSVFPAILCMGIPLGLETTAFVIANSLDFWMTRCLLLDHPVDFTESNPIARFFLEGWGFPGMFFFKVMTVLVVVGIAQFIARSKGYVARRLLCVATMTVSAVVIYSATLMVGHSG